MKRILHFILSLLLLSVLIMGGLKISSFIGNKTSINSPDTVSDKTGDSYIGQCNDLYWSCESITETPKDAVFNNIYESVKTASGKQSRYYNSLNEYQKKIYDALDSQIISFPTNSAHISGVYLSQISKKEISEAIFSWFHSNPQIYWITSSTGFVNNPSTGEIIAVYMKSYDVNPDAFINEVNKIKDSVLSCNGTYDRLHKLQEEICKLNVYDYDFTNNLMFNQTTYSALVSGKTVCAGYGRAFSYLANLCGIDVECVVTSEHLFNYYFDENGVPYLIDVCWDDGQDGKSIFYDYFLIGSDTLGKIDKTTHHTDIMYDVFPVLSKNDYERPLDDQGETTTASVTEPITEPVTEPITEPVIPEPTTEAPLLTNISIYKMPAKTNYYIGDSLDHSGIEVKLEYSDGSSKVIKNGFDIAPPSMLDAGKKMVKICYNGFTTYYYINVISPTINISGGSSGGTSTTLYVTTIPENQSVNWTSSNPDIINIVNGNITIGKITGTSTIEASFVYNGIRYSASKKVNVGYSEWSALSDYRFAKENTSDLKKECTYTLYMYYWFECECGYHSAYWNIKCPVCNRYIPFDGVKECYSPTPYTGKPYTRVNLSGEVLLKDVTGAYYNNILNNTVTYIHNTMAVNPAYRYQTRTIVIKYIQ